MLKKVFIISAIVFLSAGMAWFFLKDSANKKIEMVNKEKDEQQESNKEKEQSNNNERVVKIIEGDIEGAFLNNLGNEVIYYDNNKFLKADFSGGKRLSLLAYPFNEVEKISWSSEKNKVLVKSGGVYYVCYLNENRVEKLYSGIDNAIFNSSENKIIYKFQNEKDINVSLADLQGQNWEKLKEVDFQYVAIYFQPEKENILIAPAPWALEETKAELFNLRTKESKIILTGKFGAGYLWSPNGKKILVSHILENDKSKMTMGVMNENGGEFIGLNLPTFVEKCVWSKDNVNVYCGMINAFSSAAVLPNDWITNKHQSIDTFWKINTATGAKERLVNLADTKVEIDSFNLFLDQEEHYLFFVNKKDGDLYRINL